MHAPSHCPSHCALLVRVSAACVAARFGSALCVSPFRCGPELRALRAAGTAAQRMGAHQPTASNAQTLSCTRPRAFSVRFHSAHHHHHTPRFGCPVCRPKLICFCVCFCFCSEPLTICCIQPFHSHPIRVQFRVQFASKLNARSSARSACSACSARALTHTLSRVPSRRVASRCVALRRVITVTLLHPSESHAPVSTCALPRPSDYSYSYSCLSRALISTVVTPPASACRSLGRRNRILHFRVECWFRVGRAPSPSHACAVAGLCLPAAPSFVAGTVAYLPPSARAFVVSCAGRCVNAKIIPSSAVACCCVPFPHRFLPPTSSNRPVCGVFLRSPTPAAQCCHACRGPVP